MAGIFNEKSIKQMETLMFKLWTTFRHCYIASFIWMEYTKWFKPLPHTLTHAQILAIQSSDSEKKTAIMQFSNTFENNRFYWEMKSEKRIYITANKLRYAAENSCAFHRTNRAYWNPFFSHFVENFLKLQNNSDKTCCNLKWVWTKQLNVINCF